MLCKKKIGKFWTNILKKFKQERKDKYVYPIEIPLAGIKKEHIRFDSEAGTLIVDAEQQVIVEEAEGYSPSKMYSTFGFSRSIFLPEGIRVRDVNARIFSDRIAIGWPKNKFNQ